MTSGIYEIVNLVTGKRYIGSAVNIDKRWSTHKSDLRSNKHHCKYLQHSFNKYGENSFKFNILYECTPIKDILLFYEQLWIDFEGYDNLYNESLLAGSVMSGRKHSEETKRKISVFQTLSCGMSVIWIDLSGNILGKYESVNEAARQTGINVSAISNSANKYGKCKNTMFVKSENDIELALQRNKEICEKKKITAKQTFSKPVYQIEKQTNHIIRKWDGIRGVERELGINHGRVSKGALGKLKSSSGFIWRYVEDTNYQIGDIYPL